MVEQPFRGWIEGNLDRLHGYAYVLVDDWDESRDLVHDCVMRALGAVRRPCDEQAFRAWLFRILRNAFIDKCRKSGKEVQLDPDEDFADDEDAGWGGDSRMIDIVTVRIAMARLSVAHREIIALVDFVGLSYVETAKVLSIAEGTVMSRLCRARKALLQIVADGNVTPLARARSARQ